MTETRSVSEEHDKETGAAIDPTLQSHTAAGFDTAARSQAKVSWARFKGHKVAMASSVILILLYLLALTAPLIAPYNPDTGCPKHGSAVKTCHPLSGAVLSQARQPPNMHHWMGTDHLGRDEFSRVLYGGRVSLSVGLAVALVAGIVGTLMGALAGFYGGGVDTVLMRLTEVFLIIPSLLILLILATILGGSVLDIVVVISVLAWMPLARIVRGVFLSIKEKEYVEAARASGASGFRIIWRHMLPNTLGPITVYVTLGIAGAILAESVISFLGFGIKPPTPSWGNMIYEAKDGMITQPWLIMFPGFMIFLTVLCVNFFGDGLRDALDPTGQRIRA